MGARDLRPRRISGTGEEDQERVQEFISLALDFAPPPRPEALVRGHSESSESSTRVIVEPGDGRSHLDPTSRRTGQCAWSEFRISWRLRSCRGWHTDSHW